MFMWRNLCEAPPFSKFGDVITPMAVGSLECRHVRYIASELVVSRGRMMWVQMNGWQVMLDLHSFYQIMTHSMYKIMRTVSNASNSKILAGGRRLFLLYKSNLPVGTWVIVGALISGLLAYICAIRFWFYNKFTNSTGLLVFWRASG